MEANGGARNKEYQRIRNWLSLAGILWTLAILLAAVYGGLTNIFYSWAGALSGGRYFELFRYFLIFSVYSTIFSFPLSFFSGFTLEHRYSLSNQRLSGWLLRWGKRQILSFAISVVLILGLYGLIWNAGKIWWVAAWLAYALFSLVLGELFPVLIVPLFYKYSALPDEGLKGRISALVRRYGFKIENVFSLDLSRTTKKANAMFAGLGRAKRVVLADTLLQSFTHEEIESVVAHELGHWKHRDTWKQFGFGVITSLIGFWIASRMFGQAALEMGYGGIGDVRALPLFFLIFFVFGLVLSPLTNAFSRRVERHADLFALTATHDAASFISAMKKLSELNLADPEPHPLIEFLLYDHPAGAKRIQMAEAFERSSPQ